MQAYQSCRTVIRRSALALVYSIGLLTIIATGGGGGGGGGGNQAPRLSNLTLSATSVDFMEGGGRATIVATVNYSDAEADIVRVQVEVSDGSTLTIPVPALTATSGQLVASIEFSTDVSGVYTAQVWAVDSAGNSSNRLSTTLTVVGSTRLSDLNISAAALDQVFQPDLASYTATVTVLVSTTTVTAVTEDPNSTISVNGMNVPDGGVTEDIALDPGVNVITVQVESFDGTSTATYAIEVYREPFARFSQWSYVKASNTDADDLFGSAIALDGLTLAVGAIGEDSGATGINGDQSNDPVAGAGSGAAYVFVSDPSGIWTQQAYIKASNTDANDDFGAAVALDGDTLAVGAPLEDSNATGVNGSQGNDITTGNSGAVYIFTRDLLGVWTQQAYLKPSNTDYLDNFGATVALDGDTLVVGASGEDSIATGVNGNQADNTASDAGAAYVFTRDSFGVWTQQAYLKASNTDADDNFGEAVALSGDTLAVGASREDSAATGMNGTEGNDFATGGDSGAIYVFTRNAIGDWAQQAYIKASNTEISDWFGRTVTLEGDTLVVGATGEDSSATGINGNQDDNLSIFSGAAYVFTRDSGNWTQQAYLKASNTDDTDAFGGALQLNGNTLVVGATGEESGATGVNGNEEDNTLWKPGAAYVFTRDARQNWRQQLYLKASNTGRGDLFGGAIASVGNTLVIAASSEDSAAVGIEGNQADDNAPNAGAVFVFER